MVGHGYCEMEFIFGRLSVLLAGKRSVPQSVFIHVNISFTNKIPGPLIEVKQQSARKETCAAGGGWWWWSSVQLSEGEGWENIHNFPQEEAK